MFFSEEGIDLQKLLMTSNINTIRNNAMAVEIEVENSPGHVTATKEQERETTYMGKVQNERHRVSRIRLAQQSAEKIQRAWRRYRAKKELWMRKMRRR